MKNSSLVCLAAVGCLIFVSASHPALAKDAATVATNSCVITHGTENASCIVHVNLPAMMAKTVQKACGSQGPEYKSEWRADGTCPKENLLGTCNSGDESTYHMQTAYYKWSTAKLTNVDQLKMMCETGKGKWISP